MTPTPTDDASSEEAVEWTGMDHGDLPDVRLMCGLVDVARETVHAHSSKTKYHTRAPSNAPAIAPRADQMTFVKMPTAGLSPCARPGIMTIVCHSASNPEPLGRTRAAADCGATRDDYLQTRDEPIRGVGPDSAQPSQVHST